MSTWSTARYSLARMRWRLYLVLLVQSLLPTAYTTVRVHLLGNMPSSRGVNIASQAQWVGLFFKVRNSRVKNGLNPSKPGV